MVVLMLILITGSVHTARGHMFECIRQHQCGFYFSMVSCQYFVGSDNITSSAVKYNFEVLNWSINMSILCYVYLILHLFDTCNELIFSPAVPFPSSQY